MDIGTSILKVDIDELRFFQEVFYIFLMYMELLLLSGSLRASIAKPKFYVLITDSICVIYAGPCRCPCHSA